MLETAILADPQIEPAGLSTTGCFHAAIACVGKYLHQHGYRFTTVSPATHRRVIERDPLRTAHNLRDVFGWNLPFAEEVLPSFVLEAMSGAGLLVEETGGGVRSAVRFATLGARLYVHDGFPTQATDAVFFGPDTYRFVAAARRRLRQCDLLVDVCCGTGVGGLELTDRCQRMVLADLSAKALLFAEANRRLASSPPARLYQGDLLEGLHERPDAIIANPPYLVDALGRTYREGGGNRGTAMALRIVETALHQLAPGGQLLLYTGVPVVDGVDLFAAEALPLASAARAVINYAEIDPDVFGEELESPAYHDVERIAVVLLELTLPF